MRRSRAVFKRVLKDCKKREEEMRANAIATKYRNKDVKNFWGDINSIRSNREKLPNTIDGLVGEENIVQMWRNHFTSKLNCLEDSDEAVMLNEQMGYCTEVAPENVSASEIKNIVEGLPGNKAIGLDDIPNEFYKRAPNFIINFLVVYFNSVLNHSHVCKDISNVLLVPIIKDRLKNPSDSSNYRPIAIATASSKILEKIILSRLGEFLETSDSQWGFKKEHSTEMCVYALKEVINYYRKLSSPVFVCFLDLKSAFDRVSYRRLFRKLLYRRVPLYLVRILRNWYESQILYVAWGSSRSSPFTMGNGIRQGSLISPYLFNVYVDELNIRLNAARTGCQLAGSTANNFAYADDLALLAPTARALNDLLKICEVFAAENYIVFNTLKSVCMLVPALRAVTFVAPNIYLCGTILKYVESFRYLGHILTQEQSDEQDMLRELRSLYYRGNMLIRKFSFCTEDVKCGLFRTFCYSLYGSSLWSQFRTSVFRKLKVCYNTIFRKLARIPQWVSPRSQFVHLGVLSFGEILRKKMFSLMSRLRVNSNCVIKAIINSDASALSCIFEHYRKFLYVNPTCYVFLN